LCGFWDFSAWPFGVCLWDVNGSLTPLNPQVGIEISEKVIIHVYPKSSRFKPPRMKPSTMNVPTGGLNHKEDDPQRRARMSQMVLALHQEGLGYASHPKWFVMYMITRCLRL